MRLLYQADDGRVHLKEYTSCAVPPYATLSHTWGNEEVTFEDVVNDRYKHKVGYEKIRFCAERVRVNGLTHFWIDTCCINKADATELSEALNSMYRWYRESTRCYVYLSDVSSRKRNFDTLMERTRSDGTIQREWEPDFRASRWFTRGWTLQELLAPESVDFFSRDGQLLGNRNSLASLIQEITGLPGKVLDDNTKLSDFNIRERMQWTKRRNTTKPEDQAYCLLGIFDIFMTPRYGEGNNAWLRLKGKIQKKYDLQLDDITEAPQLTPSAQIDTTNRSDLATSQPPNFLEDLLNFLGYEHMDSRRATIKPAYSTTCEWLLRTQPYKDWIDPDFSEHSGLLWIKGKPGAGKSTLVKFLHERALRSPQNNEVIVCYYFNARGGALEKSTCGMYRSILFQLLQRARHLEQTMYNILGPGFPGSQFEWTMGKLREMLTAAVQNMGLRVKGFVDALDECDVEDIRDMIGHFEELGRMSDGSRFHICFASRHYPLIEICTSLQLIIEEELGHEEDLNRYVRKHLKIGSGKKLDGVKSELQEKANGVFLWAVLVIDILNKEFLTGKIYAVRKRLSEIPAELSDLFKEILFRDRTDMDELLLCIQWILFAKRPLDRKEFYYAMQAGSDSASETLSEWDPEFVSEDDMTRFVSHCSKGLAELTKPTKSSRSSKFNGPRVQFIHESVRDYLVKEGGLHDLWPNLQADLESLGHSQLRKCCQKYLAIDLSNVVPRTHDLSPAKSDSGVKTRHDLEMMYPFLKYAAEQVLHHANEGIAIGPAENVFLAQFDLDSWIFIMNRLAQYDTHRYPKDASLLFVLAERGCDRLVKHFFMLHMKPMPAAEDIPWVPFSGALHHRHWNTIRALLAPYGESCIDEAIEGLKCQDLTISKRADPFEWALRNEHELLAKIFVNAEYNPAKNIDRNFRHAVKRGHVGIVKFLLDIGKADANLADSDGNRPLHLAARAGHKETVELLLTTGKADANLIGYYGDMPLCIAAREGHTEIVEMLLTTGRADADPAHSNSLRPLHIAAREGHTEIVEMLLTTGKADANLVDSNGNRPLHLAAEAGHKEIVELLLTIGKAETNLADIYGDRPLHIAAREGRKEIMELLLNKSAANVYLLDASGETPLQVSRQYDRQEIVQLLSARMSAHDGMLDSAPDLLGDGTEEGPDISWENE